MANIYGDRTANNLIGTSEDDTIFGKGGKDLIFGNEGNDEIYGGRGSDTIHGDAGDDSIFGGRGSDWLDGGAGNDFLNGGNGSDTAVYNVSENINYQDAYNGGNGTDTLKISIYEGNLSTLNITEQDIINYFNNNAGNVDFSVLGFNLTAANFEMIEVEVLQFAVDDTYSATDHETFTVSDPALGLLGNDALDAQVSTVVGTTALQTNANLPDIMLAINEALGMDLSQYVLPNGETIDLGASLSVNSDGTLSYDPGFVFSSLTEGESVQTTFQYTVDNGSGGLDFADATINIQGTGDFLDVSTYTGDFTGTDGSDFTLIDTYDGTGLTTLNNLGGSDVLLIGQNLKSGTYIRGDDPSGFSPYGDDLIVIGDTKNVVISGEFGNDIIIVGSATSGTSSTLSGGQGDDLLMLFEGNYNNLIGGQGNDVMVGGSGIDYIYGSQANNLFGGEDILTGGGGADQFIYTNNPEQWNLKNDVITDFSGHDGEGDRIMISEDTVVSVQEIGNDTQLTLGGNTVTLIGVNNFDTDLDVAVW